MSLRVSTPEELRIGDSAAGSGHMLLYAFELLYAIYEEEGYNPPDIPRLILEKNLYGMEIDARAAALAAFALTMKARRYDRRFLRRAETQAVRPNICVLHSVHFTAQELAATPWLAKLGATLTDLPVRDALLHDLATAARLDNVGSLLRPQLTLAQIGRVREVIGAADDLFTHSFNERVLDVLAQVEYLALRYHVVVANPPYLGGKNVNNDLRLFLSENYDEVKSDLFAAFTVRIMEMVHRGGLIGMMTPFTWMFLTSYEPLRRRILQDFTLTTLVQPEYHAFFESAYVPICAFTIHAERIDHFKGTFIGLKDFYGADIQHEKTLEAIHNPDCGWLFRVSAADFKKIPGAPIAYWVSKGLLSCFTTFPGLGEKIELKAGMSTGDNSVFQREWFEVIQSNTSFATGNCEETLNNGVSWYPCHSGGDYRKWYGNHLTVVNWRNNGENIRKFGADTGRVRSAVRNDQYYFRRGITWTKIGSGVLSARWRPEGFLFDDTGRCGFSDHDNELISLGLMCSSVSNQFLRILSPTMSFTSGELARIPIAEPVSIAAHQNVVLQCVALTKADWDAYETSWDFTTLPLLRPEHRQATLAATYAHLRRHWQAMTDEMQRLEAENNRLFIDAYGLQDELTPDVPLHEITLTCNPHYRYGAGKSDDEYERLLLADTLREFISYAVGCMFGRYSLDKPGLVLANAGETVEDYVGRVARGEARSRFMPDRDNVIPILDGEWFADDVVERCKRFLRVTFGETHYAENLAFVEQGLGRDLRSYFLRDFYDDHVRRYQKRPIYWLFSSAAAGKGGSFNALIYMHRYRPDTVSVVLNDYLRDFQNKLAAHRSHLERVSISAASTPRDKTAALKEIDKVTKMLAELESYEREVLYPLATQQVAIDLDDGVKVNYAKFGKALKRIVGVS